VFDHEMPGSYLRSYCQTHGIKHIPGTSMYYPQMVTQWKIFLEPVIGKRSNEEMQSLIEEAEAVVRGSRYFMLRTWSS
jgi:hypothetical protein